MFNELILKREKNPPVYAEVIPPQSENSMKESEISEKDSNARSEEKQVMNILRKSILHIASLVVTIKASLSLIHSAPIELKPFNIPKTEPTVAPLQSVSSPIWTARQIDLPKSPLP